MGYFGSSSSALFLNNTLYDGSNLLPGNMATVRAVQKYSIEKFLENFLNMVVCKRKRKD